MELYLFLANKNLLLTYISHKYIAWSFPKNTSSLYIVFKQASCWQKLFCTVLFTYPIQFSVITFASRFAANNTISSWLFFIESSSLWRSTSFLALFFILNWITVTSRTIWFIFICSITLSVTSWIAGIYVVFDAF